MFLVCLTYASTPNQTYDEDGVDAYEEFVNIDAYEEVEDEETVISIPAKKENNDWDNDGVLNNEDKCPRDYGHKRNAGCPLGDPDVDQDGICDPWVSKKGLEDLFSDVCDGVDKCPNEPGPIENRGCPLGNPDVDEDGVCDPWVTENGLLKEFSNICEGYDKCPKKPGPIKNKGCPK